MPVSRGYVCGGREQVSQSRSGDKRGRSSRAWKGGWAAPHRPAVGTGPVGPTLAVFPVTRTREGNPDALGVNLQTKGESLNLSAAERGARPQVGRLSQLPACRKKPQDLSSDLIPPVAHENVEHRQESFPEDFHKMRQETPTNQDTHTVGNQAEAAGSRSENT